MRSGRQYGRLAVDVERSMLLVVCRMLAGEDADASGTPAKAGLRWLKPSTREALLKAAREEPGPGREDLHAWQSLVVRAFFRFELLLDIAACTTPTGVSIVSSGTARLARAMASRVLQVRPALAADWAHSLHGTAEVLCNIMGKASRILERAGAPPPSASGAPSSRSGSAGDGDVEDEDEDQEYPVLPTDLGRESVSLAPEDVISLRRMLALAADAANSISAVLRLAPDLAYAVVCGHPADYESLEPRQRLGGSQQSREG